MKQLKTLLALLSFSLIGSISSAQALFWGDDVALPIESNMDAHAKCVKAGYIDCSPIPTQMMDMGPEFNNYCKFSRNFVNSPRYSCFVQGTQKADPAVKLFWGEGDSIPVESTMDAHAKCVKAGYIDCSPTPTQMMSMGRRFHNYCGYWDTLVQSPRFSCYVRGTKKPETATELTAPTAPMAPAEANVPYTEMGN